MLCKFKVISTGTAKVIRLQSDVKFFETPCILAVGNTLHIPVNNYSFKKIVSYLGNPWRPQIIATILKIQ